MSLFDGVEKSVVQTRYESIKEKAPRILEGEKGRCKAIADDGRWQLAFWVVTVICGVWLGTLSTNVIANDRIRADEDCKLRDKIEALFHYNAQQFQTISGDLREIKAKMGIQVR